MEFFQQIGCAEAPPQLQPVGMTEAVVEDLDVVRQGTGALEACNDGYAPQRCSARGNRRVVRLRLPDCAAND